MFYHRKIEFTENFSHCPKKQGFGDYYVDHSTAVYPVNASGVPFTASYLQSTGDVIADLNEDLAADGTIL